MRRFNDDVANLESEGCESSRIAGHDEIFEDGGVLNLGFREQTTNCDPVRVPAFFQILR